MALNNLQVRLITAGVLIVVLLGLGTMAAYSAFAHWLLLSLVFFAVVMVAFEYSKMCSRGFDLLYKGLLYLFCFSVPVTAQFLLFTYWRSQRFLPGPGELIAIQSGVLLAGLLCFLIFATLGSRSSLQVTRGLFEDFPLGLLLVNFFGSSLLSLASLPKSYLYLLWLLLVVCLNDTAAYFIGKRFQGPRLAPIVSPNKTIVGSVAGILTGVLVGAISQGLLGFRSGFVLWFLLCLVVCAQLGDLLKSYVKRIHDQKDSGSILPGHGGVLDRIDGVLSSSPLLLLWLLFGAAL